MVPRGRDEQTWFIFRNVCALNQDRQTLVGGPFRSLRHLYEHLCVSLSLTPDFEAESLVTGRTLEYWLKCYDVLSWPLDSLGSPRRSESEHWLRQQWSEVLQTNRSLSEHNRKLQQQFDILVGENNVVRPRKEELELARQAWEHRIGPLEQRKMEPTMAVEVQRLELDAHRQTIRELERENQKLNLRFGNRVLKSPDGLRRSLMERFANEGTNSSRSK